MGFPLAKLLLCRLWRILPAWPCAPLPLLRGTKSDIEITHGLTERQNAETAPLRRFVAGRRAVRHDPFADPADRTDPARHAAFTEHRPFAADVAGHSLPPQTGRVYRVPDAAFVHHPFPALAQRRLDAAHFARWL